jgi:hypothetical protein
VLLALLLQISSYTYQVTKFSNHLGIPPPLIHTVAPSKQEPLLISWIPICSVKRQHCGYPPLFVTTDFLATAPPESLRYVAAHEVCHIYLGHYRSEWQYKDDLMHYQLTSCLIKTLGVGWKAEQQQHKNYVKYGLQPVRKRILLGGP